MSDKETNKVIIGLICPNNFAHKAGRGNEGRKHLLKQIHPALQANCGGTQMTFVLERYELNKWITKQLR